MFKNTFQSGFLSILYSVGSKPLQIWDKKASRASFEIVQRTKRPCPFIIHWFYQGSMFHLFDGYGSC